MLDKLNKFIEKANLIHNNYYDYSESVYTNALTKIKIKCPIHGTFEQTPNAHISQKQKCPKCGYLKRKNNKTNEQFVNQCIEKWGNKYNYSLTNYLNKKNKIKVICSIHGVIEQTPLCHLKNGCNFCNGRGQAKYTKELFVEKASLIHNNYYTYNNVVLNSINQKVKITCPIHGDFMQKAANHIHLKNGCPQCNGGVKNSNEEFISKANLKHLNKFEYKDLYTHSHDKIKIICPTHGEFNQIAYMHLQTDHSCPKCVAELSTSKLESEIFNFIQENYKGIIERNNRTLIQNKEIDILLPDLKLGIEVNGNYWHMEKIVGKKYHLNKLKLCEGKIKLIQIFEHEWNDKQEIVKSRIKSLIENNNKIFARKCEIITLTKEEKNSFLNKNHIQGNDNSTIYYGLMHENELIACMTFGLPRFNKQYDYELIRYCSKLNTNVIGGAGKLLKEFKRKHSGKLISYSDKRWSNGNLYKKLGFSHVGSSEPGYFYFNLKNKKVFNRMSFTKKSIKNMPYYDDKLSEHEIMSLNQYERVFDCGNDKWELII